MFANSMTATAPQLRNGATTARAGVPLWRLYVLRAAYLLLVVGLGLTIWPVILHHPHPWDTMHSVACCLLAAVQVLAIIGLRYPLQMLPLLLFEIVWKSIWLSLIAYPLWAAGEMDAATMDTVDACLMVVIFPIVIPWRYVLDNFVTKAGDRWR